MVESVYDEVLKRVVELTKELKVGDSKDNFSSGPVVNTAAVNKILNYIEIGKEEATLMVGGNVQLPTILDTTLNLLYLLTSLKMLESPKKKFSDPLRHLSKLKILMMHSALLITRNMD